MSQPCILLRSTRHALRRSVGAGQCRSLSTLKSNPHIYILPDKSSLDSQYILSLLPAASSRCSIAIGTTTSDTPTPASFTENSRFLRILHDVISQKAFMDPAMKAQAATFASSGGSTLGSGGLFFPQQGTNRRRGPGYGGGGGAGGSGAGGASAQGGYGSGGKTGFMHISDTRKPPDWGRVADPEDIFGSLEVGENGIIVGTGNYQESGTYRILTREGCLGLTDFLRKELVERLKIEEEAN